MGAFGECKLLYVDDTMLIGNKTRELDLLLESIEKLRRLRLEIEIQKSYYLCMHVDVNMPFGTGQALKKVDKANHVGGLFIEKGNINMEIAARNCKALAACNQFKVVWRNTNCRFKWKLQIHNAIIVAQLTHGLSTVSMTPTMLQKSDIFQIRGLRYISKTEHSQHSRITNEEVYGMVSTILKNAEHELDWQELEADTDKEQIQHIARLSDWVLNQHNTLLRHIARADNGNILNESL